ncbi:alpha/beta fold hydrolase [Saccharospirillum sp. HFRX-1]|uniref:alpha/beta fold hydrolase n=1 Tax=unclassified Saccharospirillum TaxID=2633430 RepID=UPI0037235C03
MKQSVHEERLKVPTVGGGHLFVRQLAPEQSTAVVLMVHGLGNQGDVFLQDGHGLANYLSEMGYTCIVPDMIGQGQSWPHRSRQLNHGAGVMIREDLPRLAAEARRIANGKPVFLVGEGFGGVLLASAYARISAMRPQVAGMVHLGTRRSTRLGGVAHGGWDAFVWQRLLPLLGSLKGEVPLHWFRKSMNAESLQLFQDAKAWNDGDWHGPGSDSFDYAAAATQLDWPASLYLARRQGGYGDHLADVREFMRELGTHNGRLLVLGKRDGNLRNYGPLSMLQHDDAWVDHFPVILDWLNERLRQMDSDDKPARHLASV